MGLHRQRSIAASTRVGSSGHDFFERDHKVGLDRCRDNINAQYKHGIRSQSTQQRDEQSVQWLCSNLLPQIFDFYPCGLSRRNLWFSCSHCCLGLSFDWPYRSRNYICCLGLHTNAGISLIKIRMQQNNS